MNNTVAPARPATRPDVVVLLADWGQWRAGALLRTDADLLSQLDAEGVNYRAATAVDCGLGRIVN